MTIVRRPLELQPATQPDPDVEWGILCNQLVFAVYPDLVAEPHTSEQAAAAAAAQLAAIHPGLECSIMRRSPGQPWREIGTGRTARQVLAARWQIRIDAGGW